MPHDASVAQAAQVTVPGRGQLLAAALLIGFANGLLPRAELSLVHQGLAMSLVNLFDVSAIVWLGLLAALALFWADNSPPRRSDYVVLAIAFAAFAVPLARLSWPALTGLALYVLLTGPASAARSGAVLTLALCAATFWARVVLQAGGDTILEGDAILVSWLTGAQRVGNTLWLREGDPFIWIEPFCSSVTNLSLALLSIVLVVEWERLGWSRRQYLRLLIACFFVVAVNSVRISALLFYPDQFELIHGPVGNMVVGWILVIGLAGIALYANNAPSRAA